MENEIILLDETYVKDLVYFIRGKYVMIDSDLAKIYGYTTKRFNQQVKNNKEKFDEDFMFQLTEDEVTNLRSQIATSSLDKSNWGGVRYMPYAFTESGVYMLMTVLKGELAIKQSKALIKIFQGMKDYIQENKLSYDNIINVAVQTEKNTNEIKQIKSEMKTIHKLLGKGINKEMLILNGKETEAMLAYNKIYSLAKKSIFIIDDYISLKTLVLLKNINPKIKVTIFSDNVNKSLHRIEYDNFIKEYPLNIEFKKTENKIHDRYLVLDYGYKTERIFTSGSSSKDSGRKITTITEMKDTKIYKPLIEDLLENEELILN